MIYHSQQSLLNADGSAYLTQTPANSAEALKFYLGAAKDCFLQKNLKPPMKGGKESSRSLIS